MLSPPLNLPAPAGVSPYTSSFDLAETCVLLNSRLGLFSAAYLRRRPLSRSYGVNLPSSLTTLLPLVLGFSPHPPVSVCGTGASSIHTAFLVSVQSPASLLCFRSLSPYSTIRTVRLCSCVPVLNNFGGYGISTVCASTTPLASP